MQKKNIYFLIVALVVLLAGGIIFYYSFYYSKKSGKTPFSQEQLREIIEKKDLAACDKIPIKEDSLICRNIIALALAKEKLDASFCKKLDNEEYQTNCRKTVLYEKAEREGIGVCQQAGTEQEKRDCEKEYYVTMAIQKNDITQCVNLENEEDINECEEDFSQWKQIK